MQATYITIQYLLFLSPAKYIPAKLAIDAIVKEANFSVEAFAFSPVRRSL